MTANQIKRIVISPPLFDHIYTESGMQKKTKRPKVTIVDAQNDEDDMNKDDKGIESFLFLILPKTSVPFCLYLY